MNKTETNWRSAMRKVTKFHGHFCISNPWHILCIIHLPFALTCFVLRNNSSECLNQAGKDISSDDLFLNNAPYIPPFMICPYMATGVKLAGLNMYTEKEQFLN